MKSNSIWTGIFGVVVVAALVLLGSFFYIRIFKPSHDFVATVKQKAAQGDPSAEASLASLYMAGHTGIPKDVAKGLELYRKAADQGNATAQITLGSYYENGFVVPQNYATAFQWYQRASEGGNLWANSYLAKMYEKGLGVNRDPAKATRLIAQLQLSTQYRLKQYLRTVSPSGGKESDAAVVKLRDAAEEGLAEAQLYMALLYVQGEGVRQDDKEAYRWALKSAEQYYPLGEVTLADILLQGRGTPRDIPTAAVWLRRAAEQGDAEGEKTLAGLYLSGAGVQRNLQEAVRLYTLAAQQNDGEAEAVLGLLYQQGLGVDMDFGKAQTWLKKAANLKSGRAYAVLGEMASQGQGGSRDLSEAIKYFRKSADLGLAEAQISLGTCYLMGIGVRQDEKEGFQWIIKAAEQDQPQAQLALAIAYEQGQGVAKDPIRAAQWYKRIRSGAEKGSQLSQLILGYMLGTGHGVDQNFTEAFRWMHQAGEFGVSEGDLGAATIYFHGLSGKRRIAEAITLLRRAAEQNQYFSQYLLGVFYHQGSGVNRDETVAQHWFERLEKEAQLGFAGAQSVLG